MKTSGAQGSLRPRHLCSRIHRCSQHFEFLNTLRRLFGQKLFNDEPAVYFSDLKIPLAMIGTNLETGQMEIYNSVSIPPWKSPKRCGGP